MLTKKFFKFVRRKFKMKLQRLFKGFEVVSQQTNHSKWPTSAQLLGSGYSGHVSN